jgi:hypothetical protein
VVIRRLAHHSLRCTTMPNVCLNGGDLQPQALFTQIVMPEEVPIAPPSQGDAQSESGYASRQAACEVGRVTGRSATWSWYCVSCKRSFGRFSVT